MAKVETYISTDLLIRLHIVLTSTGFNYGFEFRRFVNNPSKPDFSMQL
ncbi:9932_t:CDS:1, partial [Funneliformis mosseae]